MVDVDKKAILGSIDTLWGVANGLDDQAEALQTEAQRIRDYVIAIKQAAGLDNANPLA